MSGLKWRTMSHVHDRRSKRGTRGDFLIRIGLVIGGTLVILMAWFYWQMIAF